MTTTPSSYTPDELRVELERLESAQAAATSWLAAVGARHERIKEIRGLLAHLEKSAPAPAPAMEQLRSIIVNAMGALRVYRNRDEEYVIDDDSVSDVADSILVAFPAQHGIAMPDGLHPATVDLVKRFATALAEKLFAAQKKYGYDSNWMRPDWAEECQQKLVEHLDKGDPRDVAAYCAFMWHHGWTTSLPAQGEAEPVAFIDDLTLKDFRDHKNPQYPRHGVVSNDPVGPKNIALYTRPAPAAEDRDAVWNEAIEAALAVAREVQEQFKEECDFGAGISAKKISALKRQPKDRQP